jgi:hypothetical protein
MFAYMEVFYTKQALTYAYPKIMQSEWAHNQFNI